MAVPGNRQDREDVLHGRGDMHHDRKGRQSSSADNPVSCPEKAPPLPWDMQFPSSANVNCLFWITSLAENEKGVTRRITEELESFYAGIGLVWEIKEPQSAQEFLLVLDEIGRRAEAGWKPIFHLDTHGLADRGVKIHATGEFVSWPVLADKFRTINIATGNNLCVVSHACFSFHIVRELDVKKPTPFYLLLAPKEEILAGTIEDNTADFYREVFLGADILTAHEKCFPTDWEVFHCERMVAVVLSRYLDAACFGQRAQRRKEDLISKAIESGQPKNRQNLRRMRKIADKQIKPTPALIERFSKIFLIGKAPKFTIEQLTDLVLGARKAGVPPGPSPYDPPGTSM